MNVFNLPLTAPRGPRFLGAPTWQPGESADVVVVGCPVDAGKIPGGRSSAPGPRSLRHASQILTDTAVAEKRGWYDYVSDSVLLEGTSIADAGDLVINAFEPLKSLNSLPGLLQELSRHARLILLLGGDHSITHWSVQGFAAQRPGLLIFDAHEDATGVSEASPHAGNVVSYLERSGNLSRIFQYGLRGLVPARRVQPLPCRTILRTFGEAKEKIRSAALEELLVSLDLDVIDPQLIRAVAAPSPGGLHPSELLDVLRTARDASAIRMLEVLEFAPTQNEDPLQAFLVVQLIIRALHVLLGKT